MPLPVWYHKVWNVRGRIRRHFPHGGKKFPICSDNGHISAIIIYHFMEKAQLLSKGYNLQTDNWYTKCKLASDLLLQNTLLTGKIQVNSKGFFQVPYGCCKMQPQTTKYAQKDTIIWTKKRKNPSCGTMKCQSSSKYSSHSRYFVSIECSELPSRKYTQKYYSKYDMQKRSRFKRSSAESWLQQKVLSTAEDVLSLEAQLTWKSCSK